MNNEITLRTSKGEYHPGDTIYGAIYLKICRPTEGSGIKMSFKGCEKCSHDDNREVTNSLKSESAVVDISDITLYSQDDCFDFGCYTFPFKFDLPKEIAGTFSMDTKLQDTSWNVEVSYSITAYVLGSEAIKATHPVVIYQCSRNEFEESGAGTAESSSFTIQRFGFRSKIIHLTARLIQNYVETGSNLQLRLVFTNDSKVNVTGLSIQLIRSLKLIFNDAPGNRKSASMETEGNTIVIRPEGGSYTVKNISCSSEALVVGLGGINGLQVPLNETSPSGDSSNTPPSVSGKHVENHYGLEVSVTFSNGHVETLLLNVPGILPKRNSHWMDWQEPDWASSCEIKTTNSPFSVPEHLLHSEILTGLPMFQVL